MKQRKIGVLGSGQVGRVLADGFIKNGCQVMIGTRHTGKLSEWLSGVGTAGNTGSFSAAAAYGDIVVLAVKGSAAKSALEMAGSENLKGKVIIDATNPIEEAPPENGVLRFFTEQNYSLMEELQAAFPDSRFVKAFNSVGNAYMVDPALPAVPTMFICGNDDSAKQEVAEILQAFGHNPQDMGAAESARAIEPLCMLWCIPGFLHNEWSHAFGMIKAE